MKTLVLIISIVFACSLTLYSQVAVTKKNVRGNTETYEKSSTKSNHSFRNVKSKFKNSNYAKNESGAADITFPETKFVYNAIRNTFSSSELNVLAREKSRMYIGCIFNVNGSLEDMRFIVKNDLIITPEKIEILEKALTNYKVKISKPSKPNVRYVGAVIPIVFEKFINGTYKL